MNYNQETVFTLWDNKVRVLAICARTTKKYCLFQRSSNYFTEKYLQTEGTNKK